VFVSRFPLRLLCLPPPPNISTVAMRVCDLFAGLGGFTCGALEAGANVVLAIDENPVPLKLLGLNAPLTTTVVATLGRDVVDLPPAAPDLHIHLSTPCTDLSMARKGRAQDLENNGLKMIRWAVELVLERKDSSWSLENVATKATKAILSELQAEYPERVAFALFDSADFGAPQSRVRLIAGPKQLIRMLQGIPCARRVSVRDAFAKHSLAPSAPFLKNQTRGSDGTPTIRTVETQSFTVCAGHGLTWCDAAGKSVHVMTARDSAILMGYPLSWQLPKGSRASQQAVGNGICVALSKAIALAAMAVLKGEAMVATIGQTEKRSIVFVSRSKHRSLRRRVDELERMITSRDYRL
jgi:site-specific DNA-cytosine methylase